MFTRYTQKRGLSIGILPALSGRMLVVVKVQDDPTERILLAIPEYMQISFAARLGYPIPTGFKYVRVRREVESFTHHNRYGIKLSVPEPA